MRSPRSRSEVVAVSDGLSAGDMHLIGADQRSIPVSVRRNRTGRDHRPAIWAVQFVARSVLSVGEVILDTSAVSTHGTEEPILRRRRIGLTLFGGDHCSPSGIAPDKTSAIYWEGREDAQSGTHERGFSLPTDSPRCRRSGRHTETGAVAKVWKRRDGRSVLDRDGGSFPGRIFPGAQVHPCRPMATSD